MSDWQPGQPIVTPEDWQAWQEWRKASKLEAQRQRRAQLPRIDYYPSPEALAHIQRNGTRYAPLSAVIDALILAAGTPE